MVVAAYVVGSLMGFLVLTVVVAFFLPSRWAAERSIEIHAAAADVYPLIASFQHGWSRWNPFVEPHHELDYSGPESGVGAVLLWKDGGRRGRLTMTEADPTRGVAFDMEFEGFTLRGRIALEAGPVTRVTWRDEADCGRNPLVRIFGLLADRIVGKSLAKGLATIKARVEAPAVEQAVGR